MTWERHEFTPDDSEQFTALLNAELDAIQAEIGSSVDSSAFAAWIGTGRFITSSDTDGAPREPSSPALALLLPVGFSWLQDGILHVISPDDGDYLLTGLPANFEGYVKLAREDEAWSYTTSIARPMLGTGTLCYLETDADGVTLLESSWDDADLIPALPLLLGIARAGSGGEGGGGGGGIDAAEFLSLKSQVQQLRIELQQLRDSILDDSVVAVGFDSPTLIINSGKLMACAVNQDATTAKHFLAGIDMPDHTGYAQDWDGEIAPTLRIGGNSDYNEQTGVIS